MGHLNTIDSRGRCHFDSAEIQNEIESTIKISLQRTHSWPTPWNWSTRDWFYETEGVATAAAWHAAYDYSPPASIPFSSFARQRIMSSIRTRYRQEYLYGVRFSIALVENTLDTGEQSSAQRSHLDYAEPSVEPLSYGDLTNALSQLPTDQRYVIEQLFGKGYTEAQLALSLGISQRGVNKRKLSALN